MRLIPLLALALGLTAQAGRPAQAAEVGTGAGAEAPGLDAEAAIAQALAATVVIYSDDMDEAFLGSGFLYGDGTLAVTNQHVVGAAASVELRGQTGARLSARVIARDAGRDIALLAVPGAALGPGLRAAARPPATGETVYALGAPLGAEFTVTRGMVSASGRQIEDASPIRYLQHDAAVNPGSSGGPLIDAQGRLVGMNSQIADGSRLFAGVAYAMEAADIARLVPLLAAGSLREVPALGLRLRPVSRKIAAALGVEPGVGLLIDAVAPGSIAARGGLRAGDVVVAFGAGILHRPGDLALMIEARISDLPELWVLRDGFHIRVTLDLAPPRRMLARMSARPAAVKVAGYSLAGLGITVAEGGEVAALTPGSPAAFAGLAPGDRLLAINGVALDEIDLAAFEATGPLVLLVERAGTTQHVVVDPWGNGRGARPVGGANVLDPDVAIF